ncbi:hypothetical protein [Catellatospora sp. NPDC049609]|uniref:hypothetical protein n=1 Tax=Catellatospora sp. NPDC049609 TaxID=3155505 RepID=UPI00344134AB
MKASQHGLPHRGLPEPRAGHHRSRPFDATLDHQDEVETVLSQAQELIERAMSRRRGNGHHIRHLPGDDAVFQAVAGEAIMRARREVLCVLSAADVADDRRNHTVDLLRHADRRGVQVKALVPAAATAALVTADRALCDHPGYRSWDFQGQNLVLTDGREVILRTHDDDQAAQTILLSAQPLVHFLRSVFEVSWASGTPLAEIVRLSEKLREETAQSVLTYLGAGAKDEVAARRLGMSVRTYRRHVAEMMRDVSATSRFQAGMRAAELGLVNRSFGGATATAVEEDPAGGDPE